MDVFIFIYMYTTIRIQLYMIDMVLGHSCRLPSIWLAKPEFQQNLARFNRITEACSCGICACCMTFH